MTLENYFFANRNTHWFIVALSFLAPTIFIPYIFDFLFPQKVNILPLIYGGVSLIILMFIGSTIFPKILNKDIKTLPEFFEKRFDKTCRYFFSVLYIFTNIFLRLVIILIVGNYFLSSITGGNAYFTILFLLIISSIYLIVGGLRAENYVSIIQVVIITIVFTASTFWIIANSGDFSNVGLNNSQNIIYEIKAAMKLDWIDLLLGLPIIGFWFWCGDQIIIQKVFGIKNDNSVKKAPFFAGLLQFVPILIVILPSLIILTPSFTGGQASISLLNILSYPMLPQILKEGLVLAIASVLLASFTSTFNSTSLLFTFDFYKNFKSKASNEELVLIGRMSIMGLLLIAIILVSTTEELALADSVLFFKPFAYFIALSSAIIIIGLFNDTVKSASALITISVGTVILICRTIFDVFAANYPFENILLKWFARSGFLEFSVFIFFFSIILLFFFHIFLRSEKNQNLVDDNEISIKI